MVFLILLHHLLSSINIDGDLSSLLVWKWLCNILVSPPVNLLTNWLCITASYIKVSRGRAIPSSCSEWDGGHSPALYLLLFLLLWSLTRTAWHGRNYPGGQSEGSSSCKRRHGHRSMCWLMTSHPKSESRRRYRTVLSSLPPFRSTETPAQRGCYPLVGQTSVENIADTPRGGSSEWLWV